MDADVVNAAMNMVTALAVAYASYQLKRIRSDITSTRIDLEAIDDERRA